MGQWRCPLEGVVVRAAPRRLPDPDFWAGKRVLLTGHTGFKGGWLALWLERLGAEVTGFALPPEGEANLFDIVGIGSRIESQFGDIRDVEVLEALFRAFRPEIVLHLAAQAYVKRSLRDPAGTFATNVQGTVNLLDAIRMQAPETSVIVCVTSDKVYRNTGSGRPFIENHPLGGKDPYSASKAACDIAVQSWRASFTHDGAAIATVRGGNVIGGGDFGENRLVPDCVRAFAANMPLELRMPQATRPWQHVLDCLNGYLLFAEALAGQHSAPCTLPALNIGPSSDGAINVRNVAEIVVRALAAAGLPSPGIIDVPQPGSVEAKALTLDTSLARQTLGWGDYLPGEAGLRAAADWYAAWLKGEDMAAYTLAELEAFASAKPLLAKASAG